MNKIPILNHNYKSPAVILPLEFVKYQLGFKKLKKDFPEICILTSQKNIVKYFCKVFKAKLYSNWGSNRSELYVFKIGKQQVGIVNLGLGSSQAVNIMEILVARGVKDFLSIGSVGSIGKELKIGDFLLVDKALRDEGTSYHYLKPSQFAYPSKEIYNSFKSYLDDNKFVYATGPVWTTDAFFRETKASVLAYQKQGILGVDMKTSALFALAKYYKVQICALFYISDSLANLKWEPHLYSQLAKKSQKIISQITASFLKKKYG